MGGDGDDASHEVEAGRGGLAVTSVSDPPLSQSVRMRVVPNRNVVVTGVLTLIRVSWHLGGGGSRWLRRTSSVVCVWIRTVLGRGHDCGSGYTGVRVSGRLRGVGMWIGVTEMVTPLTDVSPSVEPWVISDHLYMGRRHGDDDDRVHSST